MLGDFNAKVGYGQPEEEYIGPHGIGTRNVRGQILTDFCAENRLFLMNKQISEATVEKMDVDCTQHGDEKCYRLHDDRRFAHLFRCKHHWPTSIYFGPSVAHDQADD